MGEYVQNRVEIQTRVLKVKEKRRISVGPAFEFHFENKETVLYQIQEMIRVEKIVDEAVILHEMETYSKLLPSVGVLSTTLMIGYPDSHEREHRLRALKDAVQFICFEADSRRVPAIADMDQMNAERMSAVQFLKFEVGKTVPQRASIVITHPEYHYSTALSAMDIRTLWEDISNE